jgi:hypothetical protein
LPSSTFKKSIKGCVEDGLVEHGRSRYFVTDNNCRVEVPIHAEFYFGPDRYEFIDKLKKKLEEERDKGGQGLPGISHPAQFRNT